MKKSIQAIVLVFGFLLLGTGVSACCGQSNATITYNVGEVSNASEFSSQKIQKGDSLISKSAMPAATNKIFLDWYLDSAYQNKVKFPLVVDNNITLYAKYLDGTLDETYFSYDEASDSYFVVNSEDELPKIVVVPDFYDDGVHGQKKVTKISDGNSKTDNIFGANDIVGEIYIGNNVKYLGAFAAAEAVNLNKVFMGKNVCEFPEGSRAFQNCSRLVNVTLSELMTEIPAGMFMGTGISSLDFVTDNITSFGEEAFSFCENLTDITIPKNVKSMDVFMFYGCENLENVKMHSQLEMEQLCFYQTPFENKIRDKAVECYDAKNKFLFIRAKNTLTDTTQIENFDKVVYVASRAFMPYDDANYQINLESSLTKVLFPMAQKVGESAFRDCDKLTNVDLPKVNSAPEGLFYGCESLTNLNIGKLVKIGDAAFYNAGLLTEIDLSEVETLGKSSFDGCKSLTAINIPKVETISQLCFNECEKLETVNMPNAKYIEKAAFQYCKNLNIDLPQGLLWIADFSFNHCENPTATQILIPSTVVQMGGDTYIGSNNENELLGSHIFYNCATTTLKEFVVAEGNENFVTDNGVLYTKDFKYLVSYPAAKTENSYVMHEGCEDLFELSFSRAHFLETLIISNSLVIRTDEQVPESFKNKNVNGLSGAIYYYTSIKNFVVKAENENYSSMNGVLYDYNGKKVVAVPTVNGGSLTFSDSCTEISDIPFFYHENGETLTIDEKIVGGMPDKIVIGANIVKISDKALEIINSFVKANGWIIECRSQNFQIDINGKLARI